MPLIEVALAEGRSPEKLRALISRLTDRTSADGGHTIMVNRGVEQRKQRIWLMGVVLLRATVLRRRAPGQSVAVVVKSK